MLQPAFLIRAGRHGAFIDEWLDQSIISIGFDAAGMRLVGRTRQEIRDDYSAQAGGISIGRTRRICSHAPEIATLRVERLEFLWGSEQKPHGFVELLATQVAFDRTFVQA